MNTNSFKRLAKMSLVALFAFGSPRSAQAVTVQTFVNGYYGGNYLSDGVTILTTGTTVDFGVFYQGGQFTPGATIGSDLAGADLLTFRANNGWVSFGSGTVGADGAFNLAWDLNDTGTGPGFGTEFELNPTTGLLAGKNLVGVTPYVWVQTPNQQEFWVGVSNAGLPAAGFSVYFSGDVIDTGDPSSGFSMLYGTAISDTGITTIPEPSAGVLVAVGLGIIGLRRKLGNNS